MNLDYDLANPIDGEMTVLHEKEEVNGINMDVYICFKHGLISIGEMIMPELEDKSVYLQQKKIDANGLVWYPFYQQTPDGKCKIEYSHDQKWNVITSGDLVRTINEFEEAFDYFKSVEEQYYELIQQTKSEEE